MPAYAIALGICIICFLGIFPSHAAQGSDRDLPRDLKAIVRDPGIHSANIGIVVASMTTGKTIFELNPDRLLVPASNMKLLTSAAALIILTPDFRYETRLVTNGSIRSGVLYGDLIVQGSGDPTISGYFNDNDPVWVFRDWAKRLSDMGITEIRGDLLIDNSAFPESPYGDGWNMDDTNRCFSSPRDAFTFNNNCIQLEIVISAQKEQPFQLIMEPVSDYIRLVNRLNSRRAGPGTVRLHYTDARTLQVTGSRTFGSAATIHYVPVCYPGEFGAFVFKETLAARGINVTGNLLCSRNCPNTADLAQRKKERSLTGAGSLSVRQALRDNQGYQ